MLVVELSPGRLIAQRFQLERLLGEGGMGAVWAATHVVTKKRVALKFLKPAAASSPLHVKRFLREARAASAVRHPNVVEIHDIVELDDGSPVMVMDLLVGESLAERLARQRQLELSELVRLLLPVISAVGTAHAVGIVHRDIKPDNVFLERSLDGTIVPRVLDFGIAKLSAQEGAAAETAALTNTGSVMGTPYYMAPEQVFGERDIDQRADVWAFGVMLYEALSGRRPIDGENFGQLFKFIATGEVLPLEQLAPHLPADVTNLVGRMLMKERARRPRDLREVFDVLSRYADVKVASFAGARPDLDRARESAEAFAPTQTPAHTPQQFHSGRGGTEVISAPHPSGPPASSHNDLPAAGSATAQSFSRTGGAGRLKRSPRLWLLGGLVAFAGTAGALALVSKLQTAASGVAASASAQPSISVASPPPSAVVAPPATVAESPSATPGPSASALPRQQVAARPPVAAVAKKAETAAPAAPPAATPPPARLPGGIAPNAPF
jgi:serine/threonine protein kinase